MYTYISHMTCRTLARRSCELAGWLAPRLVVGCGVVVPHRLTRWIAQLRLKFGLDSTADMRICFICGGL